MSNNDGTYRIMPLISSSRGVDVHNGTDTTMTFHGRSFPKRNGIDVQLYDYYGGSHQKWIFVNTSSAVTGVHMSNLDGTSTQFFNAAENLHNSLGSVVPCAKLTDSSATDVWKLMQSSVIFFFNGHGLQTSVSCGGGSSSLTREYVLSQPTGSLSNCKLVVYKACLTALGGKSDEGDPPINLAQATAERGATTVVGFQGSILINQADTWMTAFCNGIAGGQTVEKACENATKVVDNQYTDLGFTDTYFIFGTASQTF